MSLTTLLLLFFSFLALVFGILFIKKLYFRIKYKKRFFIIPHLSTKGIASVGIILSLSIAGVLLLIISSAGVLSLVFRLWAGTRIIIEGILIKIGGLLFGPIIGICLGAAIDMLTIAYTGGIFHYGYFISAILFGLFGGIIRLLITKPKKFKNFTFCVYSTILTFIVVGLSIILIYFSNQESIDKSFVISMMSLDFKLSFKSILLMIGLIPLAGIIIMWICYGTFKFQNNNLKKKKIEKQKKWFTYFCPVFVMVLLSELIVNVVFMPVFDQSISPLNYEMWIAIRLLLLCPMILINMVIILPVYKVINPIMKYSYEDELVEDLDTPIYIK